VAVAVSIARPGANNTNAVVYRGHVDVEERVVETQKGKCDCGCSFVISRLGGGQPATRQHNERAAQTRDARENDGGESRPV